MRYLVVAGGTAGELPQASELGTFDAVVCADGGAHNALAMGLTPAVVIGDMDSLGAELRASLQAAGCRLIVHPPAKNETDLELALLFCRDAGVRDVTVSGAFGGRPDQALANQLLLADARFRGMDLRLRTLGWEVWLARGDASITGRPGDTVSLVPLSERVTGIVTEGLQYPLEHETLRRGPARGVSNVMTGSTAQVRFTRGLLFVMHSIPEP